MSIIDKFITGIAIILVAACMLLIMFMSYFLFTDSTIIKTKEWRCLEYSRVVSSDPGTFIPAGTTISPDKSTSRLIERCIKMEYKQ